MKALLLVCTMFFFSGMMSAQSGRYAGSMKELVGKTYTDSRAIPELHDWQFREGSLLSAINDPESIVADILQKGATWIVFFAVNEDSVSNEYTIADVLEIKKVKKNQVIKTALCREGKEEDAWIVALVAPGMEEYSRAIKAWRFNRDKRRLEPVDIKNVDCLNEAMEQY